MGNISERKYGQFDCCQITGMEVILFLAVCGYNEVEKRLIRSRRSTPFYN